MFLVHSNVIPRGKSALRKPDLVGRGLKATGLIMGYARLPNWVLPAASAAIIASLALSVNSQLWVISVAALIVGAYCIGWPTHYPVLLWFVGINWLPIGADILRADLAGEQLASSSLGWYRTEAVLISLLAGVVLATGLRLGARAIGSGSSFPIDKQ